MSDLSILIKALLDPDSTKNIKAQIENLQTLLEKSPIKLKLDVDNSEFKIFSKNLNALSEKMSKSLNINPNSQGLDKLSITMNTTNKELEFIEKRIKESTNAQGQLVKEVSHFKQEVDEAGNSQTVLSKRTEETTTNYKKLREEQQRLIDDFNKRNISETDYKIKQRELEAQQFSIQLKSQMQKEQDLVIERQKTAEIQKQIDLYKLKMLGDGGNVKGELDIFANKNKGKYDAEALKKIRIDIEALNIKTPELNNNIKRTGIEFSSLKQQAAQSGNVMTRALDNMMKFARFYIVGGFLVGAVNALKGSINTIVELDSAITDLKKVSDELGESVGIKEFTKSINEMAIQVGHSTKAAIQSITDFKKLGYSLTQAQTLAEQALIYSNISDQDISGATQSIISTLKGFQLGIENVVRVMDSYNEVGNTFSVTSAGIGSALQRSSAALYEAGNTLEQSIGLIVAANSSIQDVEKIGNGLKTVSMRIRGISEESGEAIPKLDEVIKRITGVDIMKDQNTFKSTYDIMVEISKVWKSISDLDRATLLEKMFGKQQGAVGASLLNNMADGIKATETALNSFGSSAREQARYMESINYRINTLKENIVKLWNDTIDSNVIKFFVDLLTGIIKTTNAIGLLNVGLLVFVGYLGVTGKIASTLPIFMNLASAVFTLSINLGASVAMAKALSIAISTIAPMAVLGVIIGAVKIFDELTLSLKEASEAINKGFDKSKNTIDTLRNLAKEYETLAKKESKSIEDKERLLDIQMQVNSQYLYGQKNIDLYTSAIDGNTEAISENIKKIKERAKSEAEMFLKLHEAEYKAAQRYISGEDNAAGIKIIPEDALKAQMEQMDTYAKTGQKILYNNAKRNYERLLEDISNAREAIIKYKGYQDLLTESFNNVDRSADNASNSVVDYMQAVSDSKKSLDDFESSAKTLSSIMQELNNGEKLSASNLLSLLDKYPEYTSEILAANQSREKALELTNKLWEIEKQRTIDAKQAEKDILTGRLANLQILISTIATSNAIGQGVELSQFQLMLKEKAEIQKAIDEAQAFIDVYMNWTPSDFSGDDTGSKYDPLSLQQRLKELYNANRINLTEYLSSLESLEKQLYKDYANKSADEISKLLGSKDKKIAERAKSYLNLTSEIADLKEQLDKENLDKISLSFQEADDKIKDLDNSLALLGNINTVSEKAKETEILGKKFTLAEQELKKVKQQLADTSLSPEIKELLQDRKLKLEIDIIKFKDSVEEAMTELLKIQQKNDELEIEIRYKTKLDDAEKSIYGTTQEEFEKASNDRIDVLQQQIDIIEKQNDLLEEQQTRNQKLLDIDKAKLQLNNIQKEKNTWIYREGEGWVWEADPEKVKDAQDNLTKLQEDYTKWEIDLARNKHIEILRNAIKYEQEQQKAKRESYDEQKRILDAAQKLELDDITLHYQDMDTLVALGIDNLKTTYSGKWDEILGVLRDKLTQAEKLQQSLTNINDNIGVSGSGSGTTSSYNNTVDYAAILNAMEKQGDIDKALWNEMVDARLDKIEDMDISPELKNKYRQQYKKYDTGGLFPSGTAGINVSGKPEYVLNPEQTKSFIKLVGDLPKITEVLKKIDLTKMLNINMPKFPTFSPAMAGSGGMVQNYQIHIDKIETPDAQTFIDLLPTLTKQYK